MLNDSGPGHSYIFMPCLVFVAVGRAKCSKKTHSDIACHSCVELSILARFYNFIQLSRVNLIQDFKRTALGRTLLNTYSLLLLLNSGTCQSKTQFGPWLESSSFGVLLQNFNRLVKIKSKDLRRPLVWNRDWNLREITIRSFIDVLQRSLLANETTQHVIFDP